MSDFYGELSKAALEDDPLENSDPQFSGYYDKTVADLDELDAGLFGTKINATESKSSAPISIISQEARRSTGTTITGKADIKSGGQTKEPHLQSTARKSTLLKELFGNDTFSLEGPSSFERPTSKLEPPLPTSQVPYEPTTVPGRERERSLTIPREPVQDLWNKFLQDDSGPKVERVPRHQAESSESLKIWSKGVEEEPMEITRGLKSEIVENKLDTGDYSKISTHLLPKQISKEIDWEELKPKIKELIQQILDPALAEEKTVLENKVTEIKDEVAALSDANFNFKNGLRNLEEELEEHKLITLEIKKATDKSDLLQSIDELKDQLHLEIKKTKAESESAARTYYDNLEDQLQELRSETSSLRNQLQRVTDSLIDQMNSAIHHQLGEARAEIMNQLKYQVRNLDGEINAMNETLERELNEMNLKAKTLVEASRRVLEVRLKAIEGKVNELVPPEESEARLEAWRKAFDTRLAYTERRHSSSSAWQERQMVELSEHVERRLWGLFTVMTTQRLHLEELRNRQDLAEAVAAVGVTRQQHEILSKRLTELEQHSGAPETKDMEQAGRQIEQKSAQFEKRIEFVEREMFKLSRLAERLCEVLRVCETRRQVTARANLEDENLRVQERLNMAAMQAN